MAPNFHETICNFVNFGNALPITRILASKILLLHEGIFASGYEFIFQGKVKEFPAIIKWKTFL